MVVSRLLHVCLLHTTVLEEDGNMNETDREEIRTLLMEAIQKAAEDSKNTCDDDAWVEGFSGDMADEAIRSLVDASWLG